MRRMLFCTINLIEKISVHYIIMMIINLSFHKLKVAVHMLSKNAAVNQEIHGTFISIFS